MLFKSVSVMQITIDNQGRQGPPSVLVIDDETVLRDSIADYLEDNGYTVYRAENGRRGLELFDCHHPDVVLTDLRMPEVTGMEVLEAVARQSPETPVIIISGTGDIAQAIETVRRGAWDYVVKPIQDALILEHAIVKSLEKADLVRQNRIYRENLEYTLRVAESDLRMAANVQKLFLPKEPPATAHWDIAIEYRPLFQVSGDFYDFYMSEGQLLGLSLFDVSGHGVASGLITMLAKSIIFRTFMAGRHRALNDVMNDINDQLIDEIDRVGNFLTGMLLRLDGDRVEYVNAAHPPLLHKHADNGVTMAVGDSDAYSHGGFLGPRSMRMSFGQTRFTVSPGDYLVLYSDCLIETMSEEDIRYGLERLIALVAASPSGASSRQLLDYVLNDFSGYHQARSASLPDDLTIVVARRR